MLISDWRRVLLGAWSVWLCILGAAADLIVQFGGLPFDAPWWAHTIVFVAIGLVRIIKQPRLRGFWRSEDGAMRPRVLGAAGLIGAIALAAPVVERWEGLSLSAYRDVIGVWTICVGDTDDVHAGQVATTVECDDRLRRSLRSHAAALSACIPDDVEAVTPIGLGVAAISWTYNVGPTAACRSTLVRKWKARDWIGACEELPRWNRAGGAVVRGLVNRRGAERAICIAGLRDAGVM